MIEWNSERNESDKVKTAVYLVILKAFSKKAKWNERCEYSVLERKKVSGICFLIY